MDYDREGTTSSKCHKPPQDGPRDVAFPDLDTHEKPIIVESLAIDHLTAHGSLPTHWSNLCVLTKLPGAGCAHAGAMRTEIVGIGFFVPFARSVEHTFDLKSRGHV